MGAYGGPGACGWLEDCTAPAIAAAPRNQSSCIGYGATFSVAATGSTPFTYQWFHGSSPLPGQTSAALSLTNLQSSDTGSYWVAVSNACGFVNSSPATSVVNDPCMDLHMYAGMNIAGQVGRNYVLRCTTDLANTNFATWTPLATNTMTSPNWFYLDMDSPFSPKCFYGVKLAP